MNKPNLVRSMQIPPIMMQKYERYLPTAFDESLSILEKINKVIHQMGLIGELTKEMLEKWNEVYEWVMGSGLEQAVEDKLNEWLLDGTLAEIINVNIFGELNDKIDGVYSELSNEIKSVVSSIEIVQVIIDKLSGEFSVLNSISKNGRDYQFSLLDYQSLFAKTVTTIKDGSSSRFPQGMSIDYPNKRYYVARQTSGRFNDQRIYEYELGSNKLIGSKDVPTANWVYLEGLAMVNRGSDVVFIIPTKRAGQFGLFNYSTGSLENTMNFEGSFKVGVDNNKKYFICSKHGDYSDSRLNDTHNGFLLYDLNSVLNGNPVLIKKIDIVVGATLNPKTQTVTMIDDIIYLGKGVNNAEIQAVDTSGEVIHRVSYDRSQILSLINGDESNLTAIMENEGIDWIVKDGVTHLVSTVCTQGMMAFILHGDLSGTKLKRVVNNESISGVSVLGNHALFNSMRETGTPAIDTGVGNSSRLLERIEGLKDAGLYTVYAHSDTVDLPFPRNLTGFLYARSSNGTNITRANLYLMDTTGSTYTNVYDSGYGGDKWLGWNQYGSRGTSLTSGEAFDPLNSPNGSYETTSPTNEPVGGIKQYRITQFGQNRKWIECFIPSTNKYFTRSIHTDGVASPWSER